jgi:hypothetical protein
MDAEGFQPEIRSFRLHLAAEGKAAKTHTEAVTWFAPAHLLRQTSHTRWEQDVQQWIARLGSGVTERGQRQGSVIFQGRELLSWHG